MGKYRIEIKRSAVKELEQIPSKDLNKILIRIKNLADEPRPPDSKKLSSENKYRIRYRMYRILYSIVGDLLTVCVVKIGHRREAYR